MDSSPGSGIPTSPTDAPPPIRENPTLDNHLRLFLEDGFPRLDDFFSELRRYSPEFPDHANLLIFNVIGGFLHHLNLNVLHHDLDPVTATGAAINSVMGDPNVAVLVQDLMEGAVVDMVRRRVE